MSREDATDLLENKLKDYITDPVVTIRLTNLEYLS